MLRIPKIPYLIACFLLGFGTVTAQQAPCSLTNADLVSMSESGLAESTILLAIRLCDHGFDTSESGIGELKEGGLSPTVLDAVQHPELAGMESGDYSPPNAVNEIVLIDDKSRILLRRPKTTTRILSEGLLIRLSVKGFVIFEGAQSSLRLTNPVPVFEISLRVDVPNPGEPKLVRLDERSGRRQINTDLHTIGRSRNGFRKRETVPTITEKVRSYFVPDGTRYTLYRIKPRDPLTPGEYAFFPGHFPGEGYDFGVDARVD